MNIENATRKCCVICNTSILNNTIMFCMMCQKPCEANLGKAIKEYNMMGIYDAKSKCCNYDVFFQGRMTCSNSCHEKFIDDMEKQFGKYKKVMHETTGRTYKIPTRYIIEFGLRGEELPNFPEWIEEK